MTVDEKKSAYMRGTTVQYTVLIHTGKGGELTREKVRGAIVAKPVEKRADCKKEPVYKLY